MSQSRQQNTNVTVMWVVWLSMVCAIVLYQFHLGGGWLRGNDARSPLQNAASWIAFVSLLGAALVRWIFIPKASTLRNQLVLMIIGLALSEAIGFYGIFLFPGDMPEAKMVLFILSLGSALQFAPIYARRFFLEGR